MNDRLRIILLCSNVITFSQSVIVAESVTDRMISAWQAREQRYQTGRIDFECDVTYRPTFPEVKRVDLHEYTFVFDANRARYTQSGATRNLDTKTFVHRDYTKSFDGKQTYEFFDSPAHEGHPPGYVEFGRSLFPPGWNYNCTAVVMAFRPLTQSLNGVDPRTWGPPTREAEIDGRRVIVFAFENGEYSVDPAQEYLLVRQEYFALTQQRKDSRIRLDIRYKSDPEFGLIPDNWNIIRFSANPRMLKETIAGRLVSASFNEPVQDREFVIKFPPGAVVMHEPRQGKFIIRADGSYRKIDRGERRAGATYAELMTTEAPSAIAARKQWLLWFVIGVAIAGGLAYWKIKQDA